MRILKILKRLIRQEGLVVLFLGAFYLLPVFIRLISHTSLAKNLIPFLILVPLGIYPVLFFIRGILILKKEWDNGTIIHYFSSSVSSFEFTTAFSLYMLFEVLFLYFIPLLLFSFLSHSKDVIVQFTPYIGSFFLPVPLFFLSYLTGYSLYLLSRGIYIYRNTLTVFVGLFAMLVYIILFFRLRSIIPSPFTFHIITAKDHIVHKGAFLFVYPLFVSIPLFIFDLYLFKKAEY